MGEPPLSGLYKLTPGERVRRLSKWGNLTPAETALLTRSFENTPGLEGAAADSLIENVVGITGLPLGIATNFLVNGREHVVPMALEEPSVVAGASHAAKLARSGGGFESHADDPLMIGQVHLVDVEDPPKAAKEILRKKRDVLREARVEDSALERSGAGPKDVEVRIVRDGKATFLAVHLIVDVADAMGANAVNTRCERVAPLLERLTGGSARLRILSNLADRRLARAKATFRAEDLGGRDVVERVLEAVRLAAADPYRCATHNKGIMNGVDAVVVATGNDWRAVEAGAHAYAARSGRYESLTRYHKNGQGDLVGEIELPLAVGTVGGGTRANPMAALALKLLKVKGARELAEVVASVGLAQNVAALRALVVEGIQEGHMRLHRRAQR